MDQRYEYRTVHLDWSADPPRHARNVRLPASDPASLESADAAAVLRVRSSIAPLLDDGWEADGELWEAVSIETRKRQVLLPIPGQVGPMWEEYVSADVHLRRPTQPSTESARARPGGR